MPENEQPKGFDCWYIGIFVFVIVFGVVVVILMTGDDRRTSSLEVFCSMMSNMSDFNEASAYLKVLNDVDISSKCLANPFNSLEVQLIGKLVFRSYYNSGESTKRWKYRVGGIGAAIPFCENARMMKFRPKE